jgi:hypothetical protein
MSFVGKLTPVRPSAIRAPVSSFNFSQAGVASEMKALLGDANAALSGDNNAALSAETNEALPCDTAEALPAETIEALLGGTIERLDKAYSLKGQ